MQLSIFPRAQRWLAPGVVLFLAFFVFVRTVSASDEKSVKGFRKALIALSPTVDPAEAALVSETAHHTARRLAKEWRVVPPAFVQNFLISIGARQRGYCFHWAHGIGGELRKLPLKTLVLHWGEAYPDGHLEHNVVVVTALGQPFHNGYIIDGWRDAGRLVWWPVSTDDYPWKENMAETAWIQNRGPDPLKALDEPAEQAVSRDQTTRKAAANSL